MVRMIPPYVKDSTASNAEKKIFRLLSNLKMDCTVLHSLGIANHSSKIFGELDFVVISKEGILCLEVKGGEVYRDEGVWHFVNRYGNENTSAEGPFNQVIGSMFSLREYARKNFGYYDAVYKYQYACGVIFLDIVFKGKGPDIISEIIFDSREEDKKFEDYIKSVFKYWRNKCIEKHGYEGDWLTKDNIRRAEIFLRGNFGAIPSLDNIINEVDLEILSATEEQYSRLEMINDNDRVIVRGGAGTGKTLLGMEHAKKLAVTNKKVLFICYNRMLADYLNQSILINSSELKENITISTLHGLFANHVDLSDESSYRDKSNYYNNIVPKRFLEYFIQKGLKNLYDVVVIDEAQDLLKSTYLMCINELLKGGLRDGRWYIFYDHNQNIYNDEFQEAIEELKESRSVLLTLNTNCRNTKQIGIYNTILSGIKHEKYLKINGENVNIQSYKDNEDQSYKLLKYVKNLKSQGLNVGDIVILSPYSFENSCLKGENLFKSVCKFQSIINLKYRNIQSDSVKFCTIHSFKGLESKVIILIDVDKLADADRKLLNYIAISRAKTMLYILYNKNIYGELSESLIRGYQLLNAE